MNGQDESPPYLLCTDTTDCVELSYASALFLKPIAKISITVTLPHLKSGQSISNKEVIEKLRRAVKPEIFTIIKLTKSNLEFLRFDAEIENRKKLDFVIKKIDQKGIKLGGFSEILKIRAIEAKIPYPSRHDWDTFFRDTKHMNGMKPGERPDTVYIRGLPRQWFVHFDDPTQAHLSEYVVNKVFSSFGEVRIIDIPSLDPYRKLMPSSISGVSKFSYNEELLFDVYIQYKDYMGFAKCMQALQFKKLVYKRQDHAFCTNITVDFDKTKHLSEYSIRQRDVEREKLMSVELQQDVKLRKRKEIEDMKKELEKITADEQEREKNEEKENRRKAKEDKKKQKELKKRLKKILSKNRSISVDNVEDILTQKILLEERRVTIFQRKLECIRLFDKLADRVKVFDDQNLSSENSDDKDQSNLFGSWYNFQCQALYKSKKLALKKYKKYKTDENFQKYLDDSKKLRQTVQKQKKKYVKASLKEQKVIVEDETTKRKEMATRRKSIKALKIKFTERLQLQKKRVEKILKGKVRLRETEDNGKKSLNLSPSTSCGESNSDSTFNSSDLSSSGDEDKKKISIGKDEDPNSEAFQKFLQHQQYDNFNYRQNFPLNSFGSYRGPGRFFRPYNRGFRGGYGYVDRGRGFRGRGFVNRGRGNNFEFFKYFEHPIQRGQEKWFRRGGPDDEENDEYDNDRYRSRSRSRRSSSRRSYSRSSSRDSRRSYSRSRSKNRRSWSKDRSSRSRSHSRNKSDGDRSDLKRRHRSEERSKSRSRKSRSRSWSRSSRSSRRSREHENRRSRSRSRHKKRDYDVPSDVEQIEDDGFQNRGYYHKHNDKYYDNRGRGNRWNFRGFRYNNRRGSRPWRGRYRGNFHHDQEREFTVEYHNMYKRYFDSLTEKEHKRQDDDMSDEYSDDYKERRRRYSDRRRSGERSPGKPHISSKVVARMSSEDRSPSPMKVDMKLYSDRDTKRVKDRLSSKKKKKTRKNSESEQVDKDRRSDRVDDGTRYREEEERFRSQVVAKQRRHIRGRLPDSDDDKSKKKIYYKSDSEEEAYGPQPPPRSKR